MKLRREGDFSNSKYWYRHAGRHPVLTDLQTLLPTFDPLDLVDQVESVTKSTRREAILELETLQSIEMSRLLSHLLAREGK